MSAAILKKVRRVFTRPVAGGEAGVSPSREAGVHRVHVARTFRDHYGMPVTTYARKLRVHAALTIVATSSLPLSRLALESGYAD